MSDGPMSPWPPDDGAGARAAGLIAVAEDLAGEFSLRPLLERILRRCTELLGCHAGSICSVDEAAGTYRKEADIGVACQSGRVFPLTEGMTGAVVARRAPVWFPRYDDVPGGHVTPESRATLRGVIGVPLEWRGRIIGACIVFSRDSRRTFGPADAELLRLFAKHAAIALANARMHEEAEERARAEAVAAERDRLLAELHDTLAQRLVSVRAHIDSASHQLSAMTAAAPPGTGLTGAPGAVSRAGSAGRAGVAGGADGIGGTGVASAIGGAGTAGGMDTAGAAGGMGGAGTAGGMGGAGAAGEARGTGKGGERSADGAVTAAGRLGAVAVELRQASATAGDALVEARLALLGLASSPLDGRTLEAALRSEVAWAQSTGHLEAGFVSAGTPTALDGGLSREVLRTAREALTNIVAHARARTVRLGLLYEPGAVTLLVQDDGQGFDPRSGWQRDRFGLRAMSDRASALGATVEVDSLPGWGTRVRARFPYSRDTGPESPRLRVLVAAAQPALRAGLIRLLTWTEPGIDAVGEAATAEEAVAACQSLCPDVVVADLGMAAGGDGHGEPQPLGGIAGLLIHHQPDLAVVGICDADDERVAAAVRAGARGCVDTGADGPELARAVVAAGRGQAVLSGPMLRQLHRGLRGEDAAPALTDREREVRDLMEQGLPDKIIAERLVLSVKTVEKHAGAVLRKTGARNRTELAALAGRPKHR